MPTRAIRYWVFCEQDREPQQVVAESWQELKMLLDRLVAQRGPIEWMQRSYR